MSLESELQLIEKLSSEYHLLNKKLLVSINHVDQHLREAGVRVKCVMDFKIGNNESQLIWDPMNLGFNVHVQQLHCLDIDRDVIALVKAPCVVKLEAVKCLEVFLAAVRSELEKEVESLRHV